MIWTVAFYALVWFVGFCCGLLAFWLYLGLLSRMEIDDPYDR